MKKKHKKISKKRLDAEDDLIFYLRNFKKFYPDSREKFRRIIYKLVQELIEMED
ncbi:MAG: hypothetical protein LBT27_02255 [Prevotellaceae bacterium]|jgi:hypothetical protein|nr:hypothetical protein [Prevotellaceae bacterium]